MRVNAKVEVSGPLASGEAANALQDALRATVHELSQEAQTELQSFVMDKTGRATGFFQDHIIISNLKKYRDAEVVHPAYPAVLYGPWLEGTSERNRSTRFPGYHLFRLTRQRMQDKAADVAERHIDEAMRKL